MYDDPVVHPNAAGLELLRELARTGATTAEQVGKVREDLAELRGANLPVRMLQHSDELAHHHDRLTALENARAVGVEARKPWYFVAGQAVAAAMGALAGAVSAWAMGGGGPHTP